MSKEEEQSSRKDIILKEDTAVTVDVDIVPGKYRKRPHSVEAIQYQNNSDSILQWMKETYKKHGINFTPWGYNESQLKVGMMIRVIDGDVCLYHDHWMVFGHQKRFYTLPSDIFEDTYEKIDV